MEAGNTSWVSRSLVSSTALLPRQRLVELLDLRFLSQAISVANTMRIASIVTSNSPVQIGDLAQKLDCHEVNLYRMMSLLASYGIFEEKENRSFVGNEMSDAMCEDKPDNGYHFVLSHTFEPFWLSTLKMESALDKNGKTVPFESVTGEPFYNYLAKHAEEQRSFDIAIKTFTSSWQLKVPSFYDFSRYETIVDLAGGCGVMLKAILAACPNVQGTLFENATVLKDILPELLTDPNFSTRFNTKEGNFLHSVDIVADLFTVAMTLHCFDDDSLAIILKNIADAMRRKPGSKLLTLEVDYEKAFVPNTPSAARQLDMRMMLFMGGRERDVEAWKKIFSQQGIKVLQKIIFPPGFMGLECELA